MKCIITINNRHYDCRLILNSSNHKLSKNYKPLTADTFFANVNICDEIIAAIENADKADKILLNQLSSTEFKKLVAAQQISFYCKPTKYYRVSAFTARDSLSEQDDTVMDENINFHLQQLHANHLLFLTRKLSGSSLKERLQLAEHLKKNKFSFEIYDGYAEKPDDCLPLLTLNKDIHQRLKKQVDAIIFYDKWMASGLILAGGIAVALPAAFITLPSLLTPAAAAELPLDDQGNPFGLTTQNLHNISNYTPSSNWSETYTPLLQQTRVAEEIVLTPTMLQHLKKNIPLQLELFQATTPIYHGYKILLKRDALNFIMKSFVDTDGMKETFRDSDYLILEYYHLQIVYLYGVVVDSTQYLKLSKSFDDAPSFFELTHTLGILEKYTLGYISHENEVIFTYPPELALLNTATATDDDFYLQDKVTRFYFRSREDKESKYRVAKEAYDQGKRDEETLTTLFFSMPNMPEALLIKDYPIDLSQLLLLELKTPMGLYARGIFCYTVGTHNLNNQYLLQAKEAFELAFAKSRMSSANNYYLQEIEKVLNGYLRLFNKSPLLLNAVTRYRLKSGNMGVFPYTETISQLPPGTVIVMSSNDKKNPEQYFTLFIIKNFAINNNRTQIALLDSIFENGALISQGIDPRSRQPVIRTVEEVLDYLEGTVLYFRAIINLNGGQTIDLVNPDLPVIQVVSPHEWEKSLKRHDYRSLPPDDSANNLIKMLKEYDIFEDQLTTTFIQAQKSYNLGMQNKALFNLLGSLAWSSEAAGNHLLLEKIKPLFLSLYFEPNTEDDYDDVIHALYLTYLLEANIQEEVFYSITNPFSDKSERNNFFKLVTDAVNKVVEKHPDTRFTTVIVNKFNDIIRDHTRPLYAYIIFLGFIVASLTTYLARKIFSNNNNLRLLPPIPQRAPEPAPRRQLLPRSKRLQTELTSLLDKIDTAIKELKTKMTSIEELLSEDDKIATQIQRINLSEFEQGEKFAEQKIQLSDEAENISKQLNATKLGLKTLFESEKSLRHIYNCHSEFYGKDLSAFSKRLFDLADFYQDDYILILNFRNEDKIQRNYAQAFQVHRKLLPILRVALHEPTNVGMLKANEHRLEQLNLILEQIKQIQLATANISLGRLDELDNKIETLKKEISTLTVNAKTLVNLETFITQLAELELQTKRIKDWNHAPSEVETFKRQKQKEDKTQKEKHTKLNEKNRSTSASTSAPATSAPSNKTKNSSSLLSSSAVFRKPSDQEAQLKTDAISTEKQSLISYSGENSNSFKFFASSQSAVPNISHRTTLPPFFSDPKKLYESEKCVNSAYYRLLDIDDILLRNKIFQDTSFEPMNNAFKTGTLSTSDINEAYEICYYNLVRAVESLLTCARTNRDENEFGLKINIHDFVELRTGLKKLYLIENNDITNKLHVIIFSAELVKQYKAALTNLWKNNQWNFLKPWEFKKFKLVELLNTLNSTDVTELDYLKIIQRHAQLLHAIYIGKTINKNYANFCSDAVLNHALKNQACFHVMVISDCIINLNAETVNNNRFLSPNLVNMIRIIRNYIWHEDKDQSEIIFAKDDIPRVSADEIFPLLENSEKIYKKITKIIEFKNKEKIDEKADLDPEKIKSALKK